MTNISLLETVLKRRFMSIDGQTVTLLEKTGSFLGDHPYMTSLAAGYLIDQSMKKARGTSTVDVATNTFKFYARTPQERRIQRQLIDTLIDSKHYTLLRTVREGDATCWVLKRQPR